MEQDVNKVVDNLNNEWANDAALLRKRVAILLEENERLNQEMEQLKSKEEEKEEKENEV